MFKLVLEKAEEPEIKLQISVRSSKKFPIVSDNFHVFFLLNKHILISWLQSPSAVILEPQKIKSATVSPYNCHKVTGPDAMI